MRTPDSGLPPLKIERSRDRRPSEPPPEARSSRAFSLALGRLGDRRRARWAPNRHRLLRRDAVQCVRDGLEVVVEERGVGVQRHRCRLVKNKRVLKIRLAETYSEGIIIGATDTNNNDESAQKGPVGLGGHEVLAMWPRSSWA